jgi:hypothetical protein
MKIYAHAYYPTEFFFDKNCRESQNTHFMFNNFFSKNHAVCETMWKNMVETDRPQMTVW